jgi:hypothetical protein
MSIGKDSWHQPKILTQHCREVPTEDNNEELPNNVPM